MQARRLVCSGLFRTARCSQGRRHRSHIVSSTHPDVAVPDIAIHQRIFQDLPSWETRTALEDVVTGRRYSYRQVEELSGRVGAGFLRSGLKQGQVVSLVLPNIPEFPIAVLGALRAGLTITTINPLYGPDEILYQVRDSSAALIITYPEKVGEVQTALRRLGGPQPPVAVVHAPGGELPEGIRSFMELFKTSDTQPLGEVKEDPERLAFLLYSSGTTGLPKGVRIKHKNVVSNITQINNPEFIPCLPTTKDHQDVTASVLPFFHVYGLVVGALCYLTHGVKVVTLPKFDKDLYIKALSVNKATIANVVPPIAQFLANHPEVKPEILDSLRVMTNGAAALSQTDGTRLLEKKKDLHIASGYGLTESATVLTAPKKHTDLESVGYVLPSTQLKILHPESGEIMDPTTPGEICARGPQIMAGYHNNPEATSRTIIDGWLHTGDVGYIKDEKLFIVDRLKELIKVKGFQVAPMELEELLRSHPGVADAGVVGKPDPRLGESPVAFIVPTNKKPTAQELKDFIASKVVEYKQISDVIFLDAIPRNPTGKILRRLLKEKLPKN